MLQLIVRSAMCGNKARDGLVRARALASFVAILYTCFVFFALTILADLRLFVLGVLEWG